MNPQNLHSRPDSAGPQPHGAPRAPHRGLSLINDLKLLFAALGAGGSVVPMGDNGHTARLLAEYAASLRQQ
jgi:hypothetical protein